MNEVGAPLAVNAAIVGERPTGLGLYAVHLIEALAALGEPLLVYTSRPELLLRAGVAVGRAPGAVRPERGARGHLLRLAWCQSGLRWRIHRDRPRLLLNVVPEGLIGSPVPQVTVVHDLLPLHFPSEYPRQQHYFRYFVPAVLRSSRAVIVSSQSTRADVLRLLGVPADKVHVVLCGYDSAKFTPGLREDTGPREGYALYVGNVMPHKNLGRLVEAFAAATAARPARLVIRGWGRRGHVEALRRRIRALGLGARVDWQRYAEAEDLPRLYRGARMLLLPSLGEGFGLTALEAMACGTPVVASNRSSLPEVVGDAGLLVDPLDTGAITDAIARVFADDALGKVLTERGLARAATFSWERTGREVQAVLRACLRAGS